MERGSGVLLHISSLPSLYGIGTFGKEAYNFVRLLKKAKQKYWQFLPLSPTGYKDSPYQSFSTFALNPYFIDLTMLINDQFLKTEDVESLNWSIQEDKVDYGLIYQNKEKILWLAYQNGYKKIEKDVLLFYKKQKYWLEDYALFMSLKKTFNGKEWLKWDEEFKNKHKKTINQYKEENQDIILFYVFSQYIAFKQYLKLKAFANANHIQIIGDCPIYVNLDSCDVWANKDQFKLNSQYYPTIVAGVPPDYFSETGQLWGNPIYHYENMKKQGYHWWMLRLFHHNQLYDHIRLDHFRGFEAYYAIPFEDKTALNGKWFKGPDHDFFKKVFELFPNISLIAEDLGIITEEVKNLKNDFHLPGLKIVLFAFDQLDNNHPYLPKNFENNCIGYLGSHDNNTFFGYEKENQVGLKNMQDYYQCKQIEEIYQKVLEDLYASNANVVILQIQDILKQNETSRMNTPGKASNNWQYRVLKENLNEHLFDFIKELTQKYGRE